MITLIRKSFTKTTYKAVLWITLLSLAGLSSITGLFKRFSGYTGTGIGSVNGYEIDRAEFMRKRIEEERRIQYIKQQFGSNSSALLEAMGMSGNPEELALNSLIQEKLLLTCADMIPLKLSSDYIMHALENPTLVAQVLGDIVPPQLFDQQQGLNQAALLKYLQRQGMTIDSFEEAIERALKRFFIIALASGAAYVPQALLKEQFVREHSTRTFSVITVPLSSYLAQERQKKLTDDDIKKYFTAENSTKHRYWVPEKRSGFAWTFSPESYGINVSESDIERYYSVNKDTFKDAKGVYKPLKNVKPEIEKLVRAEKFKRIFAADAHHAITSIEEDPQAFDRWVEKHHGVKKSVQGDRATKSPLLAKLFDLNVGKKASMLEGSQGVVVGLESIAKSFAPDLSMVKEKVVQDIYQERSHKSLADSLKKYTNITNPQAIAQELGSHVETIKVAGDAQPQWQELGKKGLPQQRMSSLTIPGSSLVDITDHQGIIVVLSKISSFDEKLFAKEKHTLWRTLYPQESQQVAYSFIASLHKNATIKVNQSALLGGMS